MSKNKSKKMYLKRFKNAYVNYLHKCYRITPLLLTIWGIVIPLIINDFGTCIIFWSLLGIITLLLGISLIFALISMPNNVTINVGDKTITVKGGSIFDSKNPKIISFNEYFDTLVDNTIISSRTLNGMFINDKYSGNVDQLDKQIDGYITQKSILSTGTSQRAVKKAKKKKYPLGTTVKVNTSPELVDHFETEYHLVALTRFDEKENANTTKGEFIRTLISMWENIDSHSDTISVPLLGSNAIVKYNSSKLSTIDFAVVIINSFILSDSRIKNIEIILYGDDYFKVRATNIRKKIILTQ